MPTEFAIVIFPGQAQAEQALEKLQQLEKEELVVIVDAVILQKDADGNATIKDLMDPGGRRGRNFGAVVGAVIGLLGSPLGAVVGAAAGAVVGGLTAQTMDSGVKNNRITEALEAVPNNGSAVLAIYSCSANNHATEAALRALGNEVRRFALSINVETSSDPGPIVPPPVNM